MRYTTYSPAASIQPSSASRLRSPRCSARSERISQASPSGRKCCFTPSRKPRSMALFSSYTACSSVVTARAGTQGGLHTISAACPGGNRCVCCSCTRSLSPRRCRLSCAQARARADISVATTCCTPRLASKAASTPVPVPISNASSRAPGGKGASFTSATYSPRTGENTP